MFEFSEWAGLALEFGRFIEAGYGKDGKWGCRMVHSRSANSGEEMENLSTTTAANLGRLHHVEGNEGLTIDPVCFPTLLGWGQLEGLAVNKVDKRPAFRWCQDVLIDVSVPC
jgi:hypothetical protein